MNKMDDNTEIVQLSNELTYQRYVFNRSHIKEVFTKMKIPEYIALHYIDTVEQSSETHSGRTYLKELATKLQMSIPQISKLIEHLRDMGYVLWSHDGKGKDGTYVTITEKGEKLLVEQEESLKQYYGKVFEKFGKENLIRLLELMKQLETVMSSEIDMLETDTDCYEDELQE